MRKPVAQKKTESPLVMFSVVFLCLVGVYLVVGESQPEKDHQNKPATSADLASKKQKLDDTIDFHLKKSYHRSQLMSDQRDLNNKKLIRDLEAQRGHSKQLPHSIDLEVKDRAHDAFNDIKSLLPSTGDEHYMSPDDRINAIMRRQEFLSDYDSKLRVEYIRAFKQNAREEGYEIEIDEDLNVTHVRPINKKNLRLPSGGD